MDFFHNKQKSENCAISVGGEAFRALAVAFIDSINSQNSKYQSAINDQTLKKVLERFFIHYPKFISLHNGLKPAARMALLIQSARKSEIVDCFAFVLRQLAVDEMYANPTKYPEVFSGMNANTSKKHLREGSAVLPASALAALTKDLAISLTLSFVEPDKELRRREQYTNLENTSPKFKLGVQLNGGSYFPIVRKKSASDYAYVGQLAIPPIEPVMNPEAGDLGELLTEIGDDTSRRKQTFDESYRSLMSMVDAGELTKKDLIAIYIKFLSKSENGSKGHVGLFGTAKDKKPMNLDFPTPSDQHTIELLVRSLSGWVSDKLFKVDDYFEPTISRPSVTKYSSLS